MPTRAHGRVGKATAAFEKSGIFFFHPWSSHWPPKRSHADASAKKNARFTHTRARARTRTHPPIRTHAHALAHTQPLATEMLTCGDLLKTCARFTLARTHPPIHTCRRTHTHALAHGALEDVGALEGVGALEDVRGTG